MPEVSLAMLTEIHRRKSYLTEADNFPITPALLNNAVFYLTQAILCELIWRCNLQPTKLQYNFIISLSNCQELVFHVKKLWQETKIKPVFNDEDFVFICNHPIDLNNITSAAKGIVLRKIVSVQNTVSLNDRLKSACGVVFVKRGNCDRCDDAISILHLASSYSKNAKYDVVEIDELAPPLRESLFMYSNRLPIIFIGDKFVEYTDLKKKKPKEIAKMLEKCAGQTW